MQKQIFTNEIETCEPPIGKNDLLAEIEPLIREYFLGEVTYSGESLTYRLPNGQTFNLTAEYA